MKFHLRTADIYIRALVFGFLQIFFMVGATGCAVSPKTPANPPDTTEIGVELPSGEVSLKSDQQQIDKARNSLRTDIPQPVKDDNDNLAVILDLMDLRRSPEQVKSRFDSMVRFKEDKHRHEMKKARDEFRKKEDAEKEEFLKKLAEEREEFKRTRKSSRDRNKVKAFYDRQNLDRKDFFAEQKDRRKYFESELKQRDKFFRSEIRDLRNFFSRELRQYRHRYKKAQTGT